MSRALSIQNEKADTIRRIRSSKQYNSSSITSTLDRPDRVRTVLFLKSFPLLLVVQVEFVYVVVVGCCRCSRFPPPPQQVTTTYTYQ